MFDILAVTLLIILALVLAVLEYSFFPELPSQVYVRSYFMEVEFTMPIRPSEQMGL